MLLWAVDSGGTKTFGVLTDEKGRVLSQVLKGPCNLTMLGAEGCRRVLDELLEANCAEAGVRRVDVTHAFLALAGLDTEAGRRELNAVAASLFGAGAEGEPARGLAGGPAGGSADGSAGAPTKWQVENDVLAALYSGTLGAPGIVLLAGTGSMAMGLDENGVLLRAGGWGHLVGEDPGSGYYVGRRLLQHILDRYDSGEPADALTTAALESFGVTSLEELVDAVNQDETPTRVAQLARTVDQVAARQDPAALALLADAARALVRFLHMLAPRLHFSGPVPVVLAGGMFRSAAYKKAVEELLAESSGHWRPTVPKMPPVGGAYAGALLLALGEAPAAAVERFASELLAKTPTA